MKLKRRNFIRYSAMMTTGSILSFPACRSSVPPADYAPLDHARAQPVLRKNLFSGPVLIEDVQLLQYQKNFICRVRAQDGPTGLSVSNNAQMESLYPIFTNRLQSFFIGKNAVGLEDLLQQVYVHKSNYKLQNLALWVPLATIEFAILDLLGKIAGKPIGALIGDLHHESISVYRANNYRGKSPEESIELIRQNVEETQARALKFKVGGRMSNNVDHPAGRTEKLIPLVRKTFGDEMTIYADSNGSYDTSEAVRVGKMMEEYQYDFYEEPTPFDWYEETKEVCRALSVPIAGGEQEPSMRNFRWLIGNHALDIVQPDIFYFGGMIRSMKVARMAAALGKSCVPHISGSGLGYLYMMHFVSALPNAGPFHEFKGFNRSIPLHCETSDLESREGVVKVPTGPGLGVDLDPEFLEKHRVIRT